jgi:hypothetical protein
MAHGRARDEREEGSRPHNQTPALAGAHADAPPIVMLDQGLQSLPTSIV